MSFSVTPIAPLEAARHFIDKIQKPSRLLVAISGGSDSTGLLMALDRVCRDAGRADISLHAVTIDHALRPESGAEARGVAALCARMGIPHHLRRWDAPKPATGLSAAARLARYALIADVADDIGADMIVVGHTRGDQLETIAMRGARSARQDNLGLAGMADAMLYGGRHWIVRPFLNSTRQDIRDLLSGEGQSWVDDPSNDDMKYERVRMRHLPLLEDRSLMDQSIQRSTLALDAAHFVENAFQSYGHGLVGLPVTCLDASSATLRYALSAVACVIGGRRFSMAAQTLDKVMSFAMQAEPGRMTAGRVVFDCRREALYLMRENRDLPAIMIPGGGKAIWDGRMEVANLSGLDMTFRAAGSDMVAADFPASIPAGVIRRVRQTLPVIESHEGPQLAESRPEAVRMRPVLAPYDVFLPRFDYELANRIACLVGRGIYPPAPV